MVVDGGKVQKRPCGDCATDTRNRTNEALPIEVSPGVYVNLGSNPTLPRVDAPAAMGIHRPSVVIQTTAPYPCMELWSECVAGAAGQPPELADGVADSVESWRFVVFGDQSGIPVSEDVHVGDKLVYRSSAESLTVPSS